MGDSPDLEYIKRQLQKSLEHLSDHWSLQNNALDNLTRFIYDYHSYDDLVTHMGELDLEEYCEQYALHRWFNKETSEICEYFFEKHGATHATADNNYYHHTDCFIRGVPFDVKITVFPKKLPYSGESCLDRRVDRDNLIRWFYANQSSQQRKCFNNRIFVVCCGVDVHTRNSMKIDLKQIDSKIGAFVQKIVVGKMPFHELDVLSKDGVKGTVKSEILVIKPSSTPIMDKIPNVCCNYCNSPMALSVVDHPYYQGNIILKCTRCKKYSKI